MPFHLQKISISDLLVVLTLARQNMAGVFPDSEIPRWELKTGKALRLHGKSLKFPFVRKIFRISNQNFG